MFSPLTSVYPMNADLVNRSLIRGASCRLKIDLSIQLYTATENCRNGSYLNACRPQDLEVATQGCWVKCLACYREATRSSAPDRRMKPATR